MTERDDELHQLLSPLDPVAVDPPPGPGSPRFLQIEDTVMTSTRANQSVPPDHRAAPPDRPTEPVPTASFGRRSLLLVAAATVALLAGAALLLAPGSTPSAEAAVRTAAENTAEVTTFRVTLRSDDLAFLPSGEATAEVDGENVHMVAGEDEYYRVGDTEWFGQGGQFQSGPVQEDWAPFGRASADVVTAALASGRAVDEGTETVDGAETTRYVIEVDDAARAALAQVPSSSQRWFVVETSQSAEVLIDDDGNEVAVETGRAGFLEDADALVIWVADDLIHRIEVSSGSTQFTFTFSDFGADLTVTAPE